jgi:hypothetical protein
MNRIKTFKIKQTFLNSPFIPPIFFTTSANFLYWLNKSFTACTAVPLPLATREIRDGSFAKILLAFG